MDISSLYQPNLAKMPPKQLLYGTEGCVAAFVLEWPIKLYLPANPNIFPSTICPKSYIVSGVQLCLPLGKYFIFTYVDIHTAILSHCLVH